jgi:carboxylate-amine ligase
MKHWILRENKWRAIRYGLHAQIVAARNGRTKPLYKDIQDWLVKLSPYIKELKYDEHMNIVREILEKGNSSERQYKIFESTHDVKEVIRHNLREFESSQPHWPLP